MTLFDLAGPGEAIICRSRQINSAEGKKNRFTSLDRLDKRASYGRCWASRTKRDVEKACAKGRGRRGRGERERENFRGALDDDDSRARRSCSGPFFFSRDCLMRCDAMRCDEFCEKLERIDRRCNLRWMEQTRMSPKLVPSSNL